MKKLRIFLAAVLVSSVFAEPSVVYISPNNDGIQDALEVPLRIREKRYVKEWKFTVTDESGEIVRTIENKIVLPVNSAKDVAKKIFSAKKGVEIPEKIIWNGFLDDGSLAPDGIYFYQFTASDDNGNSASTSKMKVVVDNTPPEINLVRPEGSGKIFGEGDKSVLKIRQSGSVENLWTAKISDADGKIVRTYRWENSAPAEIEWNGSDDTNSILPDGVYSYEISSTDAAGNTSEKSSITNIIFSAEKPETAIIINGSRYFSPAPAGSVSVQRKTVSFGVAIPSPVSSINSLTDWTISIVGKNDDRIYFAKNGKTNPPQSFEFDGKNSAGEVLAEGEYRAKVTARYLNGYEPKAVYSPVFVLDNKAPESKVTLPQNTVFNGTSGFEISQSKTDEPSYTGEKSWTGKIIDAEKNQVVREYNFDDSLPEKIVWDGLDKNGKFVDDGKYRYVLEVTEPAGNFAMTESDVFTLDTSETELALSFSPGAFSPDGDGVQDRISIAPAAKATSGIQSYELQILSESRSVVKTFSGTGKIPSAFVWDGTDDGGKKCADGNYSAVIKAVASSGTAAEASSGIFSIDTVSPSLNHSVPYLTFSPDGKSSRQNLPVKISSASAESKWTCEIRNEKNQTVKNFVWTNSAPADFVWDGTDDSGNRAANGFYSAVFSSRDEAGNAFESSIQKIHVDDRAVSAFVTAESRGISPNGDGFLDSQKFDLKVSLNEGISSWKFEIVDEKNSAVKIYENDETKKVPSSIVWNGEKSDGTKAEGKFFGRLHLEYEKGNSADANSAAFVCTTKIPELTAKTSPKYFSPDNDGTDDDLFIQLKFQSPANLKNWSFVIKDRNGKSFWKTSGKNSISDRIVWDGRGNNGELVQSAEDYSFEFEAADDLGMKNKIDGIISVDVLVVRDGDKLKMQIPSIIFRSNEADFGVRVLDADGNVVKAGITRAQADNNERVLKRVAEILKKFKDYRVLVAGHANRTSDNSDEETKEGSWGKALIPLSEERANFVKNKLVKMGVSSSKLSVEGKGGTEPVADRKDAGVNWKNRRVEFILEK